MWGPVRLLAGLKAMLEQSCRTLSCALGAQEDAHRERVGTCSWSLRQPCSAWRQTMTRASRHRPCSHLGRYLYCECFLIKELFF